MNMAFPLIPCLGPDQLSGSGMCDGGSWEIDPGVKPDGA